MMLQIEAAYSQIKDHIEVWVKSHPANPINLTKYPKLVSKSNQQFLEDLFPKIDTPEVMPSKVINFGLFKCLNEGGPQVY